MMGWGYSEENHLNDKNRWFGVNGAYLNVNVNGSGTNHMLHGNQGVNGTSYNNALSVKVMTDEQIETLRKQIVVYATIVERQQTLSTQQGLAGGWQQSPDGDRSKPSEGFRCPRRRRWIPTREQAKILEGIYEKEKGNIKKQRITEITSELSQHGEVTGKNVSVWFQNRRARSRKQELAETSHDAEPKIKIEVDDSLYEMKTEPFYETQTEPEMIVSPQKPSTAPEDDFVCLLSPVIGSELLYFSDPKQYDEPLTGITSVMGSCDSKAGGFGVPL